VWIVFFFFPKFQKKTVFLQKAIVTKSSQNNNILELSGFNFFTFHNSFFLKKISSISFLKKFGSSTFFVIAKSKRL